MKVEMKRVATVLRFTGAIVCVLALVTVAVFAQGGDEKTWNDAVQLFQAGVTAYSEAHFWDAIGLFEEALVIVRELEERDAEGAILNSVGACYYSLSDYQRAIDYYEQALAIKREIGDYAGEAGSLNNLGACYH